VLSSLFFRAKGDGERGLWAARASLWGGFSRSTNNDRRLCRVQVVVRDNNIDQALKALKKKLQREGVFREMKLRRHYEKPSERRAREAAEAVRRARKVERKRLEREGF
jgi:small subunit ribosomal protein S21